MVSNLPTALHRAKVPYQAADLYIELCSLADAATLLLYRPIPTIAENERAPHARSSHRSYLLQKTWRYGLTTCVACDPLATATAQVGSAFAVKGLP